tara:strand:+ start:464 stop:1624 length:1161 start_codon:yes stop_codon:yes gene_type:complete
MTRPNKASVGLVQPEVFSYYESFELCSGEKLPSFEMVYETYGTLNDKKDNAILICHALSGDHHAAGYHSELDQKSGWWEHCIGPNKPIDTNKFFVVSSNNLGGCGGSTGPTSPNPNSQKPYGSDFPTILVKDWVKSQKLLAEELEVSRWLAVIGGSLGGMQAMQWAIDYPEQVNHAVVIASAAKLTAQNIAFNELAREAITSDPNFRSGDYLESHTQPNKGLMLARMIGHVTYLSDDGMDTRFGRDITSSDSAEAGGAKFEVENYLHHQGTTFTRRFDANTYILMTKALDYFDPAKDTNNNLSEAFRNAKSKFLLISFTSDWRFPVARSREITDALIHADKDVSHIIIETDKGHDSFLLPIDRYTKALSAFLNQAHVTVPKDLPVL